MIKRRAKAASEGTTSYPSELTVGHAYTLKKTPGQSLVHFGDSLVCARTLAISNSFSLHPGHVVGKVSFLRP